MLEVLAFAVPSGLFIFAVLFGLARVAKLLWSVVEAEKLSDDLKMALTISSPPVAAAVLTADAIGWEVTSQTQLAYFLLFLGLPTVALFICAFGKERHLGHDEARERFERMHPVIAVVDYWMRTVLAVAIFLGAFGVPFLIAFLGGSIYADRLFPDGLAYLLSFIGIFPATAIVFIEAPDWICPHDIESHEYGRYREKRKWQRQRRQEPQQQSVRIQRRESKSVTPPVQHRAIDTKLAAMRREFARIGAETIANWEQSTAPIIATAHELVSAIHTVDQLLQHAGGLTESQKTNLVTHLASYLARVAQADHLGHVAMFLQLAQYAKSIKGGGASG